MLFKLSLKNIKKSFKDFTIYFLTLVIAIAIFYMFNSLDAQTAMMNISCSSYDIIKLLINFITILSVFIAVVLGFLIIYANNFLVKRRKKEFGIYMTLGMGRRDISKILFIETMLVGIISLAVGLVVGIFGSQLMSVVVSKMFQADMKKFEFVFSQTAMIKTMICFGIMYVAVLFFNTVSISRYKLIDLLNAAKKNEKVAMKNTALCIIVFIAAVALLGWAYYTVTAGFSDLLSDPAGMSALLKPIAAGCVGTFLVLWSLSGFVLKLVQSNKRLYLKGTNMFVLRQLNSQVNTTVVSMTIICLMLFVTICVLSSALGLNESFNKSLKELTPVDFSLCRTIQNGKNDQIKLPNVLAEAKIDTNKFKDTVDTRTYLTSEVQTKDMIISTEEADFTTLKSDEEIIRVSDYNKIAKLYGKKQFKLNDNEYVVTCNFSTMKDFRDAKLSEGKVITIGGKQYSPKYTECQDGFLMMEANPCNLGVIIVPDSCDLSNAEAGKEYYIGNYNTDSEEEKQKIENELGTKDMDEFEKKYEFSMDAKSKKSIEAASIGLSAIVTFVALYLGVIFLLASSAILALKQLSESSDNKQRYSILRKIGTDETMINKTLFYQIGIFFMIPLTLAIVHSVFGIQFAWKVLEGIAIPKTILTSIIWTAAFIVLIYGGYFLATYYCSKNIIKEEE